jgi:hypothetical protein
MAPRATALASTLLCVCAATASQQQPPLADLTLHSATAPTLPPPLCFEPPAATPAAALSRRAAQDASGRPVWTGTTGQELWDEYGNIFRYGNRNAASHLWATFILERSWQMTPATVIELFRSFCPVSGSPVRSTNTPYRITLEASHGTAQRTGFLHHCCWPCNCDTADFLKLDTKTVETSDGPRQYWFTVIGNPCGTARGTSFLTDEFVSPFDGQTYTLNDVAREVRCGDDGELLGATLSDNGYPIIGMIHDSVEATPQLLTPLADATPGRISSSAEFGSFQDHRDMQPICQQRADTGYASGMGEIFRQVAAVAPVYNVSASWSSGGRIGVPPAGSGSGSSQQQQPQASASLQAAGASSGLAEEEQSGGPSVGVFAFAAGATVLFGVVASVAVRQRNAQHVVAANKVTEISSTDEESGAAPHEA